MATINGGGSGAESSLIFGFLVGFLGIFAVTITGGLIWPRIRLYLHRRFGIFNVEPQVASISYNVVPELWDVRVREMRGKASDCAWERLNPLALCVRTSSAMSSRSAGTSARKKWKFRSVFQTSRTDPEEEELSVMDVHDGSVAVVITMPSCSPPKQGQHLREFALGVSQVRWRGRGPHDEGGDTPRQAVT